MTPGVFESGLTGLSGDFFLRSPTLKAGKFSALSLTYRSNIDCMERSKPFKKYTKNQEASNNFKLGLALSNIPHFNSVYLKRVPFLTGIAVFPKFCTVLFFIVWGCFYGYFFVLKLLLVFIFL